MIGVLLLFGFQNAPKLSAATLSINALVEEAMDYDLQIVTIEAEVIGEVLERSDGAWINVNDGSNAIGVWIPLSEAEKIHHFGDYDHVGDTVLITGVFHRSCVEHGGEVDIHAEVIDVTATGSEVEHPLSISKLIWACSLSAVAVTFLLFHFRSNHRKKGLMKPAVEEE